MEIIELRIGNKIYGVSDRLETVTLIKENGLIESYPGLFKEANSPQEIMYRSGIPLSEEILLKVGFEKMRYENYIFKFKDYTIEVGMLKGCYFEGFLNRNAVNINYLHQLQNLYFALTGKELDVSKLI